jgi:7-cyano-7-deazaguanine synthase
MKRVVIPASGGLDSSYLIYKAVAEGYEVHPIVLDSSNGEEGRLQKGVVPAKNIAIKAGLHRNLKSLPFTPISTMEIADGNYGYRPGWHMSIALHALMYADFVDAELIWIGINASQEGFYPDQRPEMFWELSDFYNKIYRTIKTPISIELPLIDMTRTDVVREGTKLGVPWDKTITCVTTPIPVNCGVCRRCQERKNAFLEAGVSDPTIYLK